MKNNIDSFIAWNKNNWSAGGMKRWVLIGFWLAIFILITRTTGLI